MPISPRSPLSSHGGVFTFSPLNMNPRGSVSSDKAVEQLTSLLATTPSPKGSGSLRIHTADPGDHSIATLLNECAGLVDHLQSNCTSEQKLSLFSLQLKLDQIMQAHCINIAADMSLDSSKSAPSEEKTDTTSSSFNQFDWESNVVSPPRESLGALAKKGGRTPQARRKSLTKRSHNRSASTHTLSVPRFNETTSHSMPDMAPTEIASPKQGETTTNEVTTDEATNKRAEAKQRRREMLHRMSFDFDEPDGPFEMPPSSPPVKKEVDDTKKPTKKKRLSVSRKDEQKYAKLSAMLVAREKKRIKSSIDHLQKLYDTHTVPQLPVESDLPKNLIDSVFSDDFDIFEFNERAQGKPLSLLLMCIYKRCASAFEEFELNDTKFMHFAIQLEEGYLNVPYHNKLHAADVCQSMYRLISGNQTHANILSPLDLLAGTIAGAMHDYAHPGLNNPFQQHSESSLALLYNNHAVLEQYHCSQAYALLRKPKNYFFSEEPTVVQWEIREIICNTILATDMSRHWSLLPELKTLIEQKGDGQPLTDFTKKERICLLNNLLHAADIGNPTKTVPQFKRWTKMLFEEFFAQGDKEKELKIPVSYGCDRDTTNIANAQIGFCNVIVLPMYECLARVDSTLFAQRIANIHANIEYWTSQIEACEPLSKTTK